MHVLFVRNAQTRFFCFTIFLGCELRVVTRRAGSTLYTSICYVVKPFSFVHKISTVL